MVATDSCPAASVFATTGGLWCDKPDGGVASYWFQHSVPYLHQATSWEQGWFISSSIQPQQQQQQQRLQPILGDLARSLLQERRRSLGLSSPSSASAAASGCPAAEDEDEEDDDFGQLPDELLEKILAGLPLVSLFRARAVCKRWSSITSSHSFRCRLSSNRRHRPWYLMYSDSSSDSSSGGAAFDPASRRWHTFTLPASLHPSASFVASAGGLAVFLDKSPNAAAVASQDELTHSPAYVCNPITKSWRRLPPPSAPPLGASDYCAVAMSVNPGRPAAGGSTARYRVVVARSTAVSAHDYAQWRLTIEVYDSAVDRWEAPASRLLTGWRPGEESSICGGIFYCVTHATGGAAAGPSRHGLVAFELEGRRFREDILPLPCSLSCVRLVNCWERLFMVGGIGTYDFIKGVGVWEQQQQHQDQQQLDWKQQHQQQQFEWKQVSRMPTKQFHGFAGGLDDVFSCSGHGDVIYVHSYGSPQLMVFDVAQGSWSWAKACPVLKRDPLHLFTGFCFQPRLDMSV